ncbi:uncharacterized protein [Panulirus ornatus]|uniref:uncharacterized protein n=1 Tax=Panulirus ornatus TaxID=150431 RepID=UPI003A8B8C00
MKSFAVLTVLFMAALASAETENEALKETSRFGFLNLDGDSSTVTFNSTSLQYAVIAGIVILLVALVVVPLLGFDLATLFSARDGYDPYNYGYDQNNAYSSYTSYAKRSLDILSPVLTALSQAYKKYE